MKIKTNKNRTNKNRFNKNRTKRHQKAGAFPKYKISEDSSREEILGAINRFCGDNRLSNIRTLMVKLNDKVTNTKKPSPGKTHLPVNTLSSKESKTPPNPFTFRYKVPFPYANEILDTPQSCLDFYNQINKNFEPLTERTIIPCDYEGVCRYEPLVMGMVKDLLVVCIILDSLPKPSHKLRDITNPNIAVNDRYNLLLLNDDALGDVAFLAKALDCLKMFESLLTETSYKYLDFIDCLAKYIELFTVGHNEPVDLCKTSLKLLENLKSSCFILLPTFVQINYTKVLNSCAAPIINFRLPKERHWVHQEDRIPSFEIYHDIDFHGTRTHNLNRYINTRDTNKNNANYSPQEIAEEFNLKCENLSKINYLYNYNDKNLSNTFSMDEYLTDNKKYIYACILFYIIHEMRLDLNIHRSGFNIRYIIESLDKFIKNGIYNSMYGYFGLSYESFLEEFKYGKNTEFIMSLSQKNFTTVTKELERLLLK